MLKSMIFAVGEAVPLIDLSTVDFAPLYTTLIAIVPEIMPVIVTCAGVRKAVSFIQSAIRGA